MKKYFYILLFCFGFSLCEGQSWVWGRQGGSKLSHEGNSIVATDSKGNGYMSGTFVGTIGFDGDSLAQPPYSALNGYLIKYDSLGNLLWVNQVKGTSEGEITAMCVDDSDNIIVAGDYNDTIHIGGFTLTSTRALFIAKYNSAGMPIWVSQAKMSSFGIVDVSAITTDDSNNVIITGIFEDTLSFGPITCINTQRDNASYIAKYNANGVLEWVHDEKLVGGWYNNTASTAISCDKSGSIFASGWYNDSVLFGPNLLIGADDIFLIKYDRTGNFGWVKHSHTAGGTIWTDGITNDKDGYIYITGEFSKSVILDDIYLNSQGVSAFLAKYSPNNSLVWCKASSLNWVGNALTHDTGNNIYLTVGNNHNDTIIFLNDTLITNSSKSPAAFYILDTAGNVLASSINRTGGSLPYIACSGDGKYVYAGGGISDTITFGNSYLNNYSHQMPYIARWHPTKTPYKKPLVKIAENILVYPNPSSGNFIFQLSGFSGTWSVEIYDVLGQKMFSQFSIQNPTFNIDLSSNSSGVYLYKVMDESGALVGEGKVVIAK